jgi:hypothetical protein
MLVFQSFGKKCCDWLMLQTYIDIDNYWGIVVVTNFDVDKDYVELKAQLRSFGLSPKNADRALNILSNYNTGMAVSLPDLKMSAIYISKSSTPSEFYSTAIHECVHVADAILDYYGESWHGEPSAYLVGYMTKEIVERLGEPCY